MVKEGFLKEYINMWSAQFPQKMMLYQVKELKSKYGLCLRDAHKLASVIGADEEVILEVGDNVLLRKRNDGLAIFKRWVSSG